MSKSGPSLGSLWLPKHEEGDDRSIGESKCEEFILQGSEFVQMVCMYSRRSGIESYSTTAYQSSKPFLAVADGGSRIGHPCGL